MRRKIAKRWRKEALRRGAVIISEGIVIKPGERKALGLPRNNQGYALNADVNGTVYCVTDNYDALGAYRLLVEGMEMEDFA